MEKVKEQAKALIEELPEELVEGLLGFIRGLQEWEATKEILEARSLPRRSVEGSPN